VLVDTLMFTSSYLPHISVFNPISNRYRSTEIDLSVFDSSVGYGSLAEGLSYLSLEKSAYVDDDFSLIVEPDLDEELGLNYYKEIPNDEDFYVTTREYYYSHIDKGFQSHVLSPVSGDCVEDMSSSTTDAKPEDFPVSYHNFNSSNVLEYFRQLCLLRKLFIAFCISSLNVEELTCLVSDYVAELDDEKPYLIGIEPNPGPNNKRNLGNKPKPKNKNRARPRKARPPAKSGETP